MIEPISWPKMTNTEMKVEIVAAKVNELIAAMENSKEITSVIQPVLPVGCVHANIRKTRSGSWFCDDCNKFVKAPQ